MPARWTLRPNGGEASPERYQHQAKRSRTPAISLLGGWRPVLFDPTKSGLRWVWLLPAGKVSAAQLLWSTLGAVGVGFGEEVITRGSMVVGLRSRFSEGRVWLISTLLFWVLHVRHPAVAHGAARLVGQRHVPERGHRR